MGAQGTLLEDAALMEEGAESGRGVGTGGRVARTRGDTPLRRLRADKLDTGDPTEDHRQTYGKPLGCRHTKGELEELSEA